jgi:hypothetical protein
MARSFTGTELINMAKDQSDHTDSSTLSDAQWLTWLSAVMAEYHATLVETGMGFVEGVQTITGTGATTYALPTDYFGSTSVSYLDGQEYIPLEHISVLDRDSYDVTQGSDRAAAWRIAGANLELLPAPPGGTYRHVYQSGIARITSAASTFSFDRGFERLITTEMAIIARMKEEVSTSDLRAERDRLADKLDHALVAIQWGESPSIRDTQDDNPILPGDWPRRRSV